MLKDLNDIMLWCERNKKLKKVIYT